MQKKPIKEPRLELRRIAIKVLDQGQLGAVVGGAPTYNCSGHSHGIYLTRCC